jgi:hypothetical protein
MPDDGANGYEEYAEIFMRERNLKIGLSVMRKWASQLAPGSELLELGCGHGVVSQVLLEAGVKLSVVDASPLFYASFRGDFLLSELSARQHKSPSCSVVSMTAWSRGA